MLRAEQQGAHNGYQMGQRSSKADSIDTASSMDRVASNGYANGMNGGAFQPSASPRLTSSFMRSPEEGFSIRGTSKRTRDERDKDEYEPNGNYRLQFSRSNTQPMPDRYSQHGQSGSISPADTRHTLLPERSAHWSPNKKQKHLRENSGSWNAAHRQGRADQWVPSPRSPSPPPRPRPPLGPRANSALSNQSRSGSNPSMRERRGSESVERAGYTNLRWTASEPNSKQTTNNSAQRTSAATIESPLSPVEASTDRVEEPGVGQRVNVNGVKGVPTGPKSDPRAFVAVLDARKTRPYIFIPGRSLLPQTATVQHLHGFLHKYIKKMSDIKFDERGYYLYFDGSEAGVDRLDQCFWAKNRTMLFGQYVLEMVCYHNGIDDTTPTTDTTTCERQVIERSTSAGQLSDIQRQGTAVVIQAASSLPTALQGFQDVATADSRLESRKAVRATSLTVEPAVISAPPILRHSSPLRVPSRQDKDDSASSISGFTGSDLSASRVSKCHRCEGPSVSDSDSLIRCSSCPRRWHRRCHKEPISEDLEPEHTWQCRRCIKKNVQPKSRLSNAPFASVSPAPSVGRLEEPPAKRPRLTYTAPDLELANLDAVAAAIVSNGVTQQEPELQLNDMTDPIMLTPPYIPEAGTTEDPAPQVNSDELRISEVDDLVERSFTSTVETQKPEEKTKHILHLTRKKVARSEHDAITENDKNGSESNGTPSEGRVESSNSYGQDTEANEKANTPKRERHKWKGGGADKGIIEAGMQNFLSEKSALKERTAATQGRNRAEQMPASTLDPRVEVPESPADSRTANDVNGSINEKSSEQTTAQTSPKVRLKLNAPRPDESQAIKASKPQTGPAQRMKPSGISADKCVTCGRTIAFSPMGNNTCRKCKKEAASAEQTVPFAGEASTAEKIAEQDVPPATFIAAEIGDNVDALLNSAGPEEDEGNPESLGSRSPHPVEHQEPAVESPKSTRPCGSCRSRHKRCTHRADESATESGREDIAGEDTARDDLDFWNTAPENENTGNLGNSIFGDGQTPVNDHPSTTGANRDRSSSLSPAPDDTTTFPIKTKKRVSHARAATSEYDLGDSKERPPNTYKKLIGMALCAAPDYCLKASEIVHWIADNIPGYALGKGTGWESGISATLSMNRERDGIIGLWRKIGGGGTRKNDPCWYRLQPDHEYEMLHWDPVLKQPVSPMKRRDEKGGSKGNDRPMDGSRTHDVSLKDELAEPSASPTRVPKRRVKLNVSKAPSVARKHAPRSVGDVGKASHQSYLDAATSNIDIDELQAPDLTENKEAESSDDEPIATSRKKHPVEPKLVAQATIPDIEKSDDSRRKMLNGVSESSENSLSRTPAGISIMRQFKLSSPSAAVDKKLVAQLIKEDTENVDCSAKSLFNEWPELDPANEFDREAKIEEIRRRPTRKQKFGVKSHEQYSAAGEPAQLNHNDVNSYTPPKPNRPTRSFEVDVFGWQANDDVKHFDSLEEMFDLPNPRFSIMQEGQIAYRDGIRREFDGAPRRAKRIYNTGYAKHH